MKRLSRSPSSKRSSTRHVSEVTAIASEFGNSAKIIVPRSWQNIFQKILRSERKLINGALLANIIPFAGSRICNGFRFEKGLEMNTNYRRLLGWNVLRRKKYSYVSAVNWEKHGNDTSTQIQHWATIFDITNMHSLFHTLGIPVSRG